MQNSLAISGMLMELVSADSSPWLGVASSAREPRFDRFLDFCFVFFLDGVCSVLNLNSLEKTFFFFFSMVDSFLTSLRLSKLLDMTIHDFFGVSSSSSRLCKLI